MAFGLQCHGPPLWSTHGGGGTPQRAVPGLQGKCKMLKLPSHLWADWYIIGKS